MRDDELAQQGAQLVLAGWDRRVRSATALGGGMNSATALLDLDDTRAVLKWVPLSGAAGLAAGAAVARRLAGHGLLTGEPFPTMTGALTHETDHGAVALLRFVSGQALDPRNQQDQRDMASTLAAVHATAARPGAGAFMAPEISAMVHDVEPWVRPSVDLVLAEYRRLPELTWSVLHADPEAGAFLRRTGSDQVALIDWSATVDGPVLYDVASALMYLGGRRHADAFWDTYLARSPAPASELTTHVDALLRYRAAVQAAYFSMRIAGGDRTGIEHDDENRKGLRDAEKLLRANGARVTDGRV